MKKLLVILLLGFAIYNPLTAQSVGKSKDTIRKDSKEDRIYKYVINAPTAQLSDAYKANVVSIVSDPSSTLPQTDYELTFSSLTIGELVEAKSAIVYITMKADSLRDRNRELRLKIKVTDTMGKKQNPDDDASQQLLITVLPSVSDDALDDYNYLIYVGTNFDLVDGIKAKNLFFATNIYLPPNKQNKRIGYYLSLYGNRTLSSIDSSFNISKTTRIKPLTDSTGLVYRSEGTLITSRVSDNIGAYTSMLINVGKASKPENTIRFFLAPSVEFIWRRNYTNTIFKPGGTSDSTIQDINVRSETVIPTSNEFISNEFVWTLGPGFLLAHESDRISVRMHMSAGYTQSYLPERLSSSTNFSSYKRGGADIFFSGRAWITEAKSGITLQAEVTNSFGTPRPFYVVTLSKALDFKHIGSLFSPVVSR